ncbi:ester cyclase [Kitasatospora sp. NBC_00240]|uniref:nuclear transport factor 2 family protein n=1 Tax=Kitasatospora sp. NBC_00240 TaxID=2903567 RepID=UPI0022548B53|nr:nuclear transport factor 2 family protein [Kitasatospora sp. NBC_00240]MCX5209930.1 ester cyclase [Kitasatospora sp. NBC_00240]
MTTDPTRAEAHRIWEQWIALWNGDLALGKELLAERLTVHSPKLSDSIDPGLIGDRDGALALIGGVQGIAELTYTTEVGPVAEGAYLTGGWRFAGTYRGGLPEATAAPGTPVANRGIDILRIEQGQVVEWWSAAENLQLLFALGLLHAG